MSGDERAAEVGGEPESRRPERSASERERGASGDERAAEVGGEPESRRPEWSASERERGASDEWGTEREPVSSFTPAPPPPDVGSGVEWRRLDRRMLLVHPVRELIRFLPVVIGLVVAGSAGSDGEPWWFGLVGVAGAVVLGVLRWRTTRYRFSREQVQLQTGLLSRNVKTTPIDRVRTVDLTASPLHRLLGLAEVKIGTGADETTLALDGLPADRAAALREELIHARPRHAQPDHAHPEEDGPASPDAAAEEEIARLDPAWIRYALFTSTGLASAAAILGVGWQVLDRAGVDPTEGSFAQNGADALGSFGVLGIVAVLVVGGLVLVGVLSLIGYVLTFWNYRLTRHRRGGTLHVARGLFTTRATTLEERRLRGVELAETLAMRPAHGATLDAITTGLHGKSGSTALLPPAPAAVARHVADAVLAVPGTLAEPLAGHGPAATRRRYVRAGLGGVTLAVLIVAGTWWWQPVLGALALVPLLTAPWLARDRARSLGHALTERYLITRHGSVVRQTEVLERGGVIGVTLRQTYFQRRVGLATLVTASAAGSESYSVLDVPSEEAVRLACELLPACVPPLLER